MRPVPRVQETPPAHNRTTKVEFHSGRRSNQDVQAGSNPCAKLSHGITSNRSAPSLLQRARGCCIKATPTRQPFLPQLRRTTVHGCTRCFRCSPRENSGCSSSTCRPSFETAGKPANCAACDADCARRARSFTCAGLPTKSWTLMSGPDWLPQPVDDRVSTRSRLCFAAGLTRHYTPSGKTGERRRPGRLITSGGADNFQFNAPLPVPRASRNGLRKVRVGSTRLRSRHQSCQRG